MKPTVVSTCRGCGCKLTILQGVRGLCDKQECRRKDISHQETLRRLSTLKQIREQIPESWHPNTAIAILPHSSPPLIRLASNRIKSHQKYLEQIVREAKEQYDKGFIETETSATTSGIAANQAELPVLGAVCGFCGGNCCHTGGNSAWLETATIARVLRETTLHDEKNIVETYCSYLPKISYQNSCIYHAKNGCCLPRNIRSNVCNQYLCRGLGEVVRALSSEPSLCVTATLTGSAVDEIALVDVQGILEKQKPKPAP